ncbi:uncharacterized protein LOC133076399 [Eubalaena glacialis]|uniref:uncharacterized protein LOC133076399 n=1 Tax=Eubalaena glacialis TaxID=27606 RepID=UPI002A5A89F1|nr:uncharacterized protein LOC133076399 [Eubalaena glacialis]
MATEAYFGGFLVETNLLKTCVQPVFPKAACSDFRSVVAVWGLGDLERPRTLRKSRPNRARRGAGPSEEEGRGPGKGGRSHRCRPGAGHPEGRKRASQSAPKAHGRWRPRQPHRAPALAKPPKFAAPSSRFTNLGPPPAPPVRTAEGSSTGHRSRSLNSWKKEGVAAVFTCPLSSGQKLWGCESVLPGPGKHQSCGLKTSRFSGPALLHPEILLWCGSPRRVTLCFSDSPLWYPRRLAASWASPGSQC